jgi:hypothetical protein
VFAYCTPTCLGAPKQASMTLKEIRDGSELKLLIVFRLKINVKLEVGRAYILQAWVGLGLILSGSGFFGL